MTKVTNFPEVTEVKKLTNIFSYAIKWAILVRPVLGQLVFLTIGFSDNWFKVNLSNKFFSVLCGPPGSGKTMTLFSALRALPDMEVVGLNFSSATTPGKYLEPNLTLENKIKQFRL